MKVITANVNGIRATAKKGFFTWLKQEDADIVCIQETKAQQHQLTDPIFHPNGYYCYYHDAVKKGYSGVAVYTKIKPLEVIFGIGLEYIDCEGRYLEIRYENFSLVSLYMHSGSSGEKRQALKYQFMKDLSPYLQKLKTLKENIIVSGDFNIVHKEIDIKNWKANQKNSGCLPEERAWLDKLFTTNNFADAFRIINQDDSQYTWWSNRGQARANNVGWRIDYQVISPPLKSLVKTVEIYTKERFSDHAPLIIDYDINLH
jgi:exodeoxyribonuclease-3